MCGSAECSGDMYAGAPQIADSGTARIDGVRVKATAADLTSPPRVAGGYHRHVAGRFLAGSGRAPAARC